MVMEIMKSKKMILSLAAFVAIMIGYYAFSQSSSIERVALPSESSLEIYHITIVFAEAYLVKDGEKAVLIETGIPGKSKLLEKEIRSIGIDPRDISLVVVTHGHGDHAGSARFLQELGIPVVGGVGDLEKFQSGKTQLSKSDKMGFAAYVFGIISDTSFDAFTPNSIVHDEFDLSSFGIQGTVVSTGGHTPGSLAVIIENKYLFVGDLLRGDLGRKGIPMEHFFQENRAEAKKQLVHLLEKYPDAQIIFPTHNGMLKRSDVDTYLDR